MDHIVTRRALGVGAVALLFAAKAAAQEKPVRVRGTIEKVDGLTLGVKTRQGEAVTVKLADNVTVNALLRASLADIHADSFIGVTAVPQTGGIWRALEVHIFP